MRTLLAAAAGAHRPDDRGLDGVRLALHHERLETLDVGLALRAGKDGFGGDDGAGQGLAHHGVARFVASPMTA